MPRSRLKYHAVYTPTAHEIPCKVFQATPIWGSTLTCTLHSRNGGLPIIWWCYWNELCRKLDNYWGRLENILNSGAWRSQYRHSSSYHDDNIVHRNGCCESSKWLSGRGSLASCGLAAKPSRHGPMTIVDSHSFAFAALAPIAHESGSRDSVYIQARIIRVPKCA